MSVTCTKCRTVIKPKYNCDQCNPKDRVVERILELIHNYGELDARPENEYERIIDTTCKDLHSQIKKKFLQGKK